MRLSGLLVVSEQSSLCADNCLLRSQSLKFLTECAPKSARLTRWALAPQEYLINVKYKKGSANTLADGLSRL